MYVCVCIYVQSLIQCFVFQVPEQFSDEIQRILSILAEIYDQLQSAELNAGDYDDFSKQEDKLKVFLVLVYGCQH